MICRYIYPSPLSLWRRKWQPTPVFLPAEHWGQRSLLGCCPWGCTELDTTEATWQQQQPFPFANRELVFYVCESISVFLFVCLFVFVFFLILFYFYTWNTVLVLPNIKTNPPQVYMCSPSWTLLSPPSPHHPSGSSQCTSPKHPVSCIEPGLATRFIHDITRFNAVLPNLPTLSLSNRVHKTVLYISVSFAVSYTGLLLPSF